MAPMIAAQTAAGGLGTGWARWAVLVLWAGGVTTGYVMDDVGRSDAAERLYICAVLLALVTALLVTEHSDRVLSRGKAAATGLGAAGAGILGAASLQAGAEVWVVTFGATIGALLIARGNVWWGAATSVAVLVPALAVGIGRGLHPLDIAAQVGTPVIVATLAVVWRLGLLAIVRWETGHRSAQARAALAAEASAVATEEYSRQLQRIRDDALPALERIIAQDELTEDQLAELSVIEGAIRDRMRSPLARDDALIDAIARARRRGVRVLLLWDGDPAGTPHPRLVAALAAIVDEARTGSLVIRGGDGRGEMSVMRTGQGEVSRIVLDDAGATIAVR